MQLLGNACTGRDSVAGAMGVIASEWRTIAAR
jgi:hypothetical protein